MNSGSYFETVSEVCESWDRLKRIPTYQELFGIAFFERMFEIDPEAWSIFPWTPKQFQEKDPVFLKFANKFVRMLELSVDLLGPDMDIVEEQLYDLGKSHKRYGCEPKHFDIMGQALIDTLKKVLGKRSFTARTEQAWKEIYEFMSLTMIQGSAGI